MESDNRSSSRTTSPDNLESELNFKLAIREAFEILTRKRKVFLFVALAAIVTAITDHYVFPSYSVDSHLIIESQNSQSGLKALLGSMELMGRETSSSESQDEKVLLLLDSSEFRRLFNESLQKDPKFETVKEDILKPLNIFAKIKRTTASLRRFFTARKKEPKYALSPTKLNFIKKGILKIEFSSSTPEATVFLMNHFLGTAVRLLSSREEVKVEEAKAYLQAKIQETQGKLAGTDRKMLNLSTKNASLSLLAPQSAISERLLDFKGQIQKHQLTYDQNEKVIKSLKARLAAGGDASTIDPNAPTPPFSTMVGIKKTIANLETDNELLAMKINTLKAGLTDTLKVNSSLPKDEQDLAELKRDKSLDYYIFDNLIKTLLQVEVKGLSLLSQVYPLELVSLDEVTLTSGLLRQIFVCILLSMLLASGCIYGLDYLNPVIRSKKDIEHNKVSFLGSVPSIGSDYFQGEKDALICRFGLESKETIAFKHIRSRLAHLSKYSGTNSRKVVSFLSYGNSEGKSFISLNVAACFARSGTGKTLLLDFDLRRGTLSKQFNQTKNPGLCAYLENNVSLDKVLVPGILPNLDLIPAGEWHPGISERLSNDKFRELIEKVRDKYEFIVIDTAPIVVAPESLAIAQDSDFAVLVATMWKTKKEYFVEAVEEIQNVRTSHLHVLLNHAKEINDSLISNYYYMAKKTKPVMQRPSTSITNAPQASLDN